MDKKSTRLAFNLQDSQGQVFQLPSLSQPTSYSRQDQYPQQYPLQTQLRVNKREQNAPKTIYSILFKILSKENMLNKKAKSFLAEINKDKTFCNPLKFYQFSKKVGLLKIIIKKLPELIQQRISKKIRRQSNKVKIEHFGQVIFEIFNQKDFYKRQRRMYSGKMEQRYGSKALKQMQNFRKMLKKIPKRKFIKKQIVLPKWRKIQAQQKRDQVTL